MSVASAAPTDPTLKKLFNVMGPVRAELLIAEILREIDRPGLETANDRYRFATVLMKRGGVLEAVGRAIRIQAILLGAEET